MAAVFASVVQCPLEHVKCQMQARRVREEETKIMQGGAGSRFHRHMSSVRVVYRGLGE